MAHIGRYYPYWQQGRFMSNIAYNPNYPAAELSADGYIAGRAVGDGSPSAWRGMVPYALIASTRSWVYSVTLSGTLGIPYDLRLHWRKRDSPNNWECALQVLVGGVDQIDGLYWSGVGSQADTGAAVSDAAGHYVSGAVVEIIAAPIQPRLWSQGLPYPPSSPVLIWTP